MKRLWRMRVIKILVAGLVLIATLFWLRAAAVGVLDRYLLSGWGLAALLIFLLLFNARKQVTTLPLGSAWLWAQLHTYAGLLSLVLFFEHLNYQWPNGIFETSLALTFLMVALSGIFGLVVSRLLPRFMAARGERILLSRISGYRHVLANQVVEKIEAAVEAGASPYFLKFCSGRVAPYMQGTKDIFRHLALRDPIAASWEGQLTRVKTYLSVAENTVIEELRELLQKKAELDFQYVMQLILRMWLIAHIAISYVLLIFVLAHIALVYGFVGR